MRWLDRLERALGSWTVPQLPLLIVTANGFVYLMEMFRPEFLSRLTLDPWAIQHGEWWRVFTFLFIPPMLHPILMVFSLYMLFYCAQTLEQEWGEFRFNVFYAVGALTTILAALFIVQAPMTNVPLNTIIFLAFATLRPDLELLLFFVIPVKVKYIGWFFWALMAWEFIAGTFSARVSILASLVNYFLFFGPQLWDAARLRWSVLQNRKRFRSPPDDPQ